MIPQTKLYSQWKGHILYIEAEEIKALFGINVVKGYHVLPSIRDYWFTKSDLGVSYVAKVMPLKRFEEIRSYLHFNDNHLMKTKLNPGHDRTFKVRPVLDHFNAFVAAMAPSQFQFIDKHMIKCKGHNILRQYVKEKPIQRGFKLWCQCAAKTGYLYEYDLFTGKKVWPN